MICLKRFFEIKVGPPLCEDEPTHVTQLCSTHLLIVVEILILHSSGIGKDKDTMVFLLGMQSLFLLEEDKDCTSTERYTQDN